MLPQPQRPASAPSTPLPATSRVEREAQPLQAGRGHIHSRRGCRPAPSTQPCCLPALPQVFIPDECPAHQTPSQHPLPADSPAGGSGRKDPTQAAALLPVSGTGRLCVLPAQAVVSDSAEWEGTRRHLLLPVPGLQVQVQGQGASRFSVCRGLACWFIDGRHLAVSSNDGRGHSGSLL